MEFSPRTCLKRANVQLNINTEEADRYACLELRQCIEAIAYKKLKAYQKRIPKLLFSKWQPAQVIAVLSELEPYSDLDSKISIFQENSAGDPEKHVLTFEQKEISVKFINKRYHKLGSYLHAPTISDQSKKSNPKRFHDYLLNLSGELEKYAKATMYSTVATTTSLDCSECQQKIIRNTNSLHKGSIIKCFNPQCQAQYVLENISGNTYSFKLNQATINCECGEVAYIHVHRIKENSHVVCGNCGEEYIFQKRWHVAKYA